MDLDQQFLANKPCDRISELLFGGGGVRSFDPVGDDLPISFIPIAGKQGNAYLFFQLPNKQAHAVGDFDFSHPVPGQGRGWVFQFNLSPGF